MIYNSKPKDFNSKFTIVSCFIFVENEFLMLKRSINETLPKKWGLSAGKVKKNEEIIDATVREVNEETGLCVSKEKIHYWGKVYVRYPKYDCIFHMSKIILETKPSIILRANEHSEYKWVTVNEALKLDLVPDMDNCIYEFFKKEIFKKKLFFWHSFFLWRFFVFFMIT